MHKTHASRVGVAAACAIAAMALVAPAAQAAVTDHGGAALRDGDHTAAVEAAIEAGPARNVILLIGDGMGDSEITIARNYEHGAGGRLEGIDNLPLRGAYTTYRDRKSTRLNSSHVAISYAVFCLKKKNI